MVTNNLKTYLRDLNIIKFNLTKFYYHSCSEWLKKDIANCLLAVQDEIILYSVKTSEKTIKTSQTTIFDEVTL